MYKYNQYTDSGLEWLGEIPAHWKMIPLSLCFSENKEINSSLSDITSLQFKQGEIIQKPETKFDSELAKVLEKYTIIKPNDIIVNGLNLNYDFLTQRIAIAKQNGIITSAYISLRPQKKINPFYYCYYLKSMDFQKVLNGMGVGIRLTLSYNELKRIYIPLPPITEQDRIAKFLDFKCQQIDTTIAKIESIIDCLKEQRLMTIQTAITKGINSEAKYTDSGVDWIDRIPSHWKVKKLKYALKQINIKRSSINNNLPYIGMENVESWTGKFIESDSEVEGLSNYFHAGNVLFGKLRPYLAKVYRANTDGLCSTEFIVYDVLDNNSMYIQNLLLSPSFINIVNASTYGSKMPRANSNFIGNLKIAIPPPIEQKQIANYLNNINKKIEAAIHLKQDEITHLKEYKHSLINSIVTGKIKITKDDE